jgi:hypothetical protein
MTLAISRTGQWAELGLGKVKQHIHLRCKIRAGSNKLSNQDKLYFNATFKKSN